MIERVAGHDALYGSSSVHRIVIGTEFYFLTLPPPQHSNGSLQIPSMNKCANLGAIQNSFSYSKTSFLQGLFSDRTLTRSALGPSAHGVDSEWSAVCISTVCVVCGGRPETEDREGGGPRCAGGWRVIVVAGRKRALQFATYNEQLSGALA